jgi:hypothetical protein
MDELSYSITRKDTVATFATKRDLVCMPHCVVQKGENVSGIAVHAEMCLGEKKGVKVRCHCTLEM